MDGISVVLLIIIGVMAAIGYITYRIVKGLLCGIKNTGKKVKYKITKKA